jgi:serine/threonine protein kinase
VFDRMVSGIKAREERLLHRLRQLRRELTDSTAVPAPAPAVERVAEEGPVATGQRVASRYEIQAHLGTGGMGMVYRARDLELQEDVALKVVRRDIVREDPTILDRLKSEIRLARRISHRNVVRAHDLGEFRGVYFITMEYVRGITVSDLLLRRGRLSIESTLAIGAQLCEALAVAHDQSIVHRDVKPANLLLDPDGVLKVMDFGIARSMSREPTGITARGFVVGTPHYMAPELMMGGTADARSDLFAVGVVLYECLTGRLPFHDDSPQALLSSIQTGNFASVSSLNADVPRRLEALIHQQVRYVAAERIGSARELAEKLAEIDSTSPR